MAKVGVSLKINVSQIDKLRLFSGQKGKYLDATVFIDLDQLDQYGNSGMITQDVSKDEKAQGVKGNILGNCKLFWTEGGQAPQQQSQSGQGFQQAPQPQGGFNPQAQQGAHAMLNGNDQPLQRAQQAPTQQAAPNQQGWGQAPAQQQPAPMSTEFDDSIPF